MAILAAVSLAAALLPAAGADPAPTDGSGEARLSLDVREADVVDVVRVLAELGGFQVVMDPGISCKLTLKLKEVRWSAVLDMALRSCGLAKEEDNDIVRIAPASRLTQEAADRAKLEEQKALAAPRHVTMMRLSYARAQELAPVVKKMLSPRGDVIWDARTNTLIVID